MEDEICAKPIRKLQRDGTPSPDPTILLLGGRARAETRDWRLLVRAQLVEDWQSRGSSGLNETRPPSFCVAPKEGGRSTRSARPGLRITRYSAMYSHKVTGPLKEHEAILHHVMIPAM